MSESLFLGFTDTMRAVRAERWKLIVYPTINHRQAFFPAEDPSEMSNLAEHSDQAGRVNLIKLYSGNGSSSLETISH